MDIEKEIIDKTFIQRLERIDPAIKKHLADNYNAGAKHDEKAWALSLAGLLIAARKMGQQEGMLRR